MDEVDEMPDWYNQGSLGAQCCPQCQDEHTRGHCDGWTPYCECDCAS